MSAGFLLQTFLVLLAAGLVGQRLARWLRVPDIVVYLGLGIALGPMGAHLLNIPQGSRLSETLVTFGAAFLIFEGGTTLRLAVLNRVWISLAALATLGVAVTAAVTALFGLWLGLPAGAAVLLGTITAATDPATLVPIFRQVPIRDRVAQTVLAESALNDAVAAIATFSAVGLVAGGEISLGTTALSLVWKAAAGLGWGVAVGALASLPAVRRALSPEAGPVVLVLAVLGAYLGAEAVQASGFMAAFAAGAAVGHRRPDPALEHDVAPLSLVLRLMIFLLLGSQVSFSLLAAYGGQGLVLLAAFVFVARPAAVFLCAAPDRRARWSLKELLFLCWTRETGVLPAALVALLAGRGVPGMDAVAAVTFVFILGTILLQAPTTAWLAGRLGLLQNPKPSRGF